MQAVSISFVPLFGDIGSTPPNGVSIHLFGPTERRLKRLPSHHTLVYTVVRVYASQGIVWEAPFTGIEAVPLIDEGCVVALAPQDLAAEDCLPSIAVARPLVQNENPREVSNIDDSLKQLAGQVVESHAWTLAANVQRSQLLSALARNL